MTKRLTLFLVTIVLSFLSTGCKKYLEVDLPSDLTLTEAVFASPSTANGAMLNIYGQLFDGASGPFRISWLTGISGDELKPYNPQVQDTYLNSGTAKSGFTGFTWNDSYNLIYQANAVYEGCGRSTSITVELKQQLQSEALFTRAYLHFLLYNLYGEIPIVTTTNYATNAVTNRKSKSDVFAQIIADLNAAIAGLSDKYIAADGVTQSTERIRPTKAVATAFLARVYLYMEDYAQAVNLSSSLITNSSYGLTDLNGVFLANNKEAIWQLKFTANAFYNTQEGNEYILAASPVTLSANEISSELLSAFDSSDLRRALWIGKFTDDTGIDYFYPFKYKIKNDADGMEYSTVLRLAEQFLIRAEAKTQLNQLEAAITDLDLIRNRANLPRLAVVKPDISKQDLLDSIMIERRREFFTENGHRWFDLKRTKTIDQVMIVVTPAKGGPAWTSNKQLWPIPQTELIANPNLKQNAGYEQ